MKTNLITFTAVLALAGLLFSGSANAQKTSDVVNFSLILNPIQSIKVNTGLENTKIEYSSVEDYNKGVSVEVPNQLNVFSTHSYQITAQATEFTKSGTTTGNPGINSINVLVSNDGATEIKTGVSLKTTPETVYTSSTATKNVKGLDLDVKYTGLDGFKYAERDFFTPTTGSPVKTTYTTTVTYSIVAL